MAQTENLLHTSALRRKLKEGKTAIGCWMGISDPLAVEALAADDNLDWMQVELEHSGLD